MEMSAELDSEGFAQVCITVLTRESVDTVINICEICARASRLAMALMVEGKHDKTTVGQQVCQLLRRLKCP
jgi:hypothetical protein